MADRWLQANAAHDFYIVLKVFTGYQACASQPDGWHQYAPASASQRVVGHSYSISPGFWKADEPSPRLARDLPRWKQNIQDQVASGEPWQLVTTFNEWGEGTAVEGASEWGPAGGKGIYLNNLHWDGSPPPLNQPVIAAAGDISCDPDGARFNGGIGTTNSAASSTPPTCSAAARRRPPARRPPVRGRRCCRASSARTT